MIKRVILDVDNTLIKWDMNTFKPMLETLNEHNIHVDNVEEKVEQAIVDYEKTNMKRYKLKTWAKYLSKVLAVNITVDIMNEWLDKIKNHYYVTPKTKETLEYLSSKYKLGIFSNFFENVQKERLTKAGIINYFDFVYGADKVNRKPMKQGYKKACKGYKKNECIMIGDNFDTDILGANNYGIQSIHIKVDEINKLKGIL